RGDITTLAVDAIVNAANSSLLGGGGVDGAIHRAAGRELKKECAKLNGCNTGDAKITRAYNLPCKRVIHTVGPMGEHPNALASCYNKSLKLLHSYSLNSIAFPCISTGIYGYPNLKAAHVALNTVRDFLESDEGQSVESVVFCIFLDIDWNIYNELMPLYFPSSSSGDGNVEEDDGDKNWEDVEDHEN
ncbi:O-acetyl-ADP-ribose deacetylase macrod1, partial [Rhizoclosmatium hyalinum]